MYVTNFKTFYILLNTLNDNQMVFSFNFKTDVFFELGKRPVSCLFEQI